MATKTGRMLIVDDESLIRDSLSLWFGKGGYQVTTAHDAQHALQIMQDDLFDVALLDIKMPGMDGVELQQRLHAIDPAVAVIMMTAFASVDTAVRALRQGAFDYVTKPVELDELAHLVARAMEQRRLRDENLQLRETIDDLVGGNEIVGDSPAMCKVLELVKHVAQTDATVLILGESGTGKEVIARAIHANSKRKYNPLVTVNCGALPEALLESELFGHEKGAFTSAHDRHKGKLEMANSGTLFLDEVGSITTKMQVDLLRILEEKSLTRVGGSSSVPLDFRVICATNEDLEQAIADGRFRGDFFYRINVFSIELPPLRERRSDVPALANHFVAKFARQMEKRVTGISPAAMDLLTDYDWPGNVRELANAIERAMVLAVPPMIQAEDLPVRKKSSSRTAVNMSLAEIEKRHIAAVLESTAGNVTQAAGILKVDRVTVYNKIKKYDLRSHKSGK